MEKVYKYPSCLTVSGYSRSIVQDLFKSKYYFIPNILVDLLSDINGKTINEVINSGKYDKNVIDEYISFLKEKDLICLSEQSLTYKELELKFYYPARISNAIIVITTHDNNLSEIIKQLEYLCCENIQIYFETLMTTQDVYNVLSYFESSRVSSIELIIKYNKILDNLEVLRRFFISEKRIFKIIFYQANKSEKVNIDEFGYKHVYFVEDDLNYNDCGCIHPLYLQTNLLFFTEAQNHNTCLNRKVCIDGNGNIKNCPSMNKSYGNIKDTTIAKIINREDFKSLWNINKDNVDVCKDCEFRYMCSDCRAFLKDSENIYSQPAKCPYNPYICKWNGMEGFVPVEECGTYTKEKGFVPDRGKIEEFNKQIWGE